MGQGAPVVTNFLIGVWRSGALMGLTQDEAFFVRCGRTTMTQDDIDNGRLICSAVNCRHFVATTQAY